MNMYIEGGELMSDLKTRLFDLRTDAGLSMAELAKKVGTYQSRISDIESGKSCIKADDLPKYADALNTTVSYIVTGKYPENETICDELGLSNKTIETLREWKKVDPSGSGAIYAQHVIDFLVEDGVLLYCIGHYLFDSFDELLFFDFGKKKKQPVALNLSEDTTITPDDYERLSRLKMLDALKDARDTLKGAESVETWKR